MMGSSPGSNLKNDSDSGFFDSNPQKSDFTHPSEGLSLARLDSDSMPQQPNCCVFQPTNNACLCMVENDKKTL